MKVFITGGTGFLGSYIISELIGNGHTVKAIRRSSARPVFIPASVFEGVEWVDGDILDILSLEEAMEDTDAVIHAAGKVSFLPRDEKQLYKINIEGTVNTVNAALSRNIERFVYISSVAALGKAPNGGIIREGEQWQERSFHSHYAISKNQAEMEVWRGMGEGLKVTVVNPSTILGYGDWNSGSCAIFKSVFDELPWYTNGMNGFVDVKDTARAIVRLLDAENSGEQFIVSGENWAFRHLFDTIADAFGKKRPSREATPFLSAMAWRLEKVKSLFNGRSPLLTRETAAMALRETRFDNSKIVSQLPGFSFTPLEQTIREACQSYLKFL